MNAKSLKQTLVITRNTFMAATLRHRIWESRSVHGKTAHLECYQYSNTNRFRKFLVTYHYAVAATMLRLRFGLV